ncbi:MAG: hypothetical protein ACREM6_12655, partial [Vulcanimicrobiaceae bacterium]
VQPARRRLARRARPNATVIHPGFRDLCMVMQREENLCQNFPNVKKALSLAIKKQAAPTTDRSSI